MAVELVWLAYLLLAIDVLEWGAALVYREQLAQVAADDVAHDELGAVVLERYVGGGVEELSAEGFVDKPFDEGLFL